MHRASQPEEIAEVIAFLASPKASYITGTTVAAGRWTQSNLAEPPQPSMQIPPGEPTVTSQSNHGPEPNQVVSLGHEATEVDMGREQARAGGSGAEERDRRRGDAGDGPERVVVVGGGYAGLFAARRASGRRRCGPARGGCR